MIDSRLIQVIYLTQEKYKINHWIGFGAVAGSWPFRTIINNNKYFLKKFKLRSLSCIVKIFREFISQTQLADF
ncbi:MAG TPA: hypothetical protein DCY27_13390 [Desulfobacterales bacterium]|nr:hypothetical protein [Desulfobacterales bacterium]